MSKTLQITVTDETARQIRDLMAITGHERPGALINLLVRRYGPDLVRCLTGDVLTAQDVPPTTQDINSLNPPELPRSSPVHVPTAQDMPPKSPLDLIVEMNFDR